MPSLLLALMLLAGDGGGPRFEGSVAAGGGYDSNLLVAPGADAAGSTVASLSATGGVGLELSEDAFLYVGAALDGAKFPTLPELDRTGAGASASLLVDLVGPLAVVVGASGGYGWYADPARSGANLTGRVTLRYRPVAWLTTRVGYSHILRTAVDPVYGSNFDRIFGEVEFRPARSTWISVAAFGERGDTTFYREILPVEQATPTAATAAAVVETTFEPYRAPSTTTGLGLGFEQGLGDGFSVELGASWRRTTTPDGDYSGPSATASVVWRFD